MSPITPSSASSAKTTGMTPRASESARATTAAPDGPSFSQMAAEIQARETEPVVIRTTEPGGTWVELLGGGQTSGCRPSRAPLVEAVDPSSAEIQVDQPIHSFVHVLLLFVAALDGADDDVF